MKLTLPVILLAAIATVGCQNKKRSDTSPMPAAGVLHVPDAPVAQYTPPPAPQAVVYDTPQQRPQPVIEDAIAVEVEPAPAPAPQRQVAPRQVVQRSTGSKYTVKKGESLWSIAEDRYGDGNKWKRIAAANPKLNPDRVQAGQTIVLP